jgi:hypothetical protein
VKRLVVVAGSLAGAGLILWAVMMLGAWGYDHRRASLHVRRLQHALEQKPTIEQVTEGLRQEGTLVVDSAADAEGLGRLAARWAGPQAPDVLEKGKRWRRARAFAAGNVVYVLYFNDDGIMTDFTYVGR